MAKVSLKNLLISGGYGLVDLGLEEYPMSLMGVNAVDIVRLGTAIGSYAANYMGYFPDVTETLFYSSLPLAMKSAYSLVKKYTVGATRAAPKALGLTVTPPPVSPKLEFIGIR